MAVPAPDTLPVPRHDFFQTPTHISLSLYIKGYQGTPVEAEYHTHSVAVRLPANPATGDGRGGQFVVGPLAGGIVPDRCEMRVLGTKIELKLAKDDPGAHWPALLATSPADHTRPSTPNVTSPMSNSGGSSYFPPLTRGAPPSTSAPTTANAGTTLDPSSALASGSRPKPKPKPAKNWDKLADELDDPDTEGEGGGDAALQKLFSSIYGNADEDTRRAMIKSFTESGGTTLSTDWGSVGKVPVRPPEGMYEMKM